MNILRFVPGVVTLGFGGYLCMTDKPYGWFLGIGFILALAALGGMKNDD